MRQHTTKAGLLAVAAALLIGSPAPGQTKEEMQDLRRDVNQLRDEVDRLRSRLETDRRDATAANRALLSRLEEMTHELRRLNDGRAVRSTSAFGREAVRETSTLRFTNTRLGPATVVVDGVTHRVEPLSTRVLPGMPAGTVSYQVFVDGWELPAQATRLYGNDTVTVNIR